MTSRPLSNQGRVHHSPEVQVFAVDSAAWRSALRRLPHDVYHLPTYCAIEAERRGARAAAVHVRVDRHELLMPVYLQSVSDRITERRDLWEAFSPYGYASPIVSPNIDNEAFAVLAQHAMQALREMGAVTLFCRLHPLLDLPLEALAELGAVVEHGPTVKIDLRVPTETLRDDLRTNHKRDIKKLRGAGYSVVWGDWNRYADFQRQYTATMDRVDAADEYFFGDRYFEALSTSLGEHIAFGAVVGPDGTTVAGALFFRCSGIVQYHLGATAPEHHHRSPIKLVLWEAVKRHASEGCSVFHLGGGLGGREDSLYRFKAGYSSSTGQYRTFRAVLDEDAYQMLIDRWHAIGGSVDGDTFPAYGRASGAQDG